MAMLQLRLQAEEKKRMNFVLLLAQKNLNRTAVDDEGTKKERLRSRNIERTTP